MEVILGVGLLLVIIGALIKYAKFYWLIPGWSSMLAHEKKKMDKEGLSVFVGNGIFLLALVLVAGEYLNQLIDFADVFPVALFLFVAITAYLIMAAPRYHKDNRKKDVYIENINKNALTAAATIFVSGLLVMGFLHFVIL